MSIKLFETRNSLKVKLKARGLIFNESELDSVLTKYNYFNLFNGLETIFLESNNPKTYHNIKLKDFLSFYKFDKELTSILMKYLDEIEEQLKASVSYHFAKRHCATLNDTMQYTNKNNYMDPANSTVGDPTYCRYSSAYPFATAQNRSIYNNFNDFILFRRNFLTTLVNKNDHIRLSFYQAPSYSPPADVAVYSDSTGTPNPNVAVPFWVSIETLQFGELLRLLHYLQDDVMEDVLKDFNLPLSKRTAFLNMIDILLCLRNCCAHTTLINRFRSQEKYKISNLLITAFSLSPKNIAPSASVIKLFDTIKIINFFTDVSEIKKILRKLMVKNIISMGPKNGFKINHEILDRMGNDKYSDWISMLSGKEYIL